MAIRFPLGNDIFTEIRKNGDYYVDKTPFIEELLKESFKVNLLTRPRRFGKTLTMSMLEDFFDIGRNSGEDFRGLAICKNEGLCARWMNQWPTIFLTFKSVSGNNFEGAYGMFQALIADVCKKYPYLETCERADAADREIFNKLKFQKASDVDLKNSLYILTRMMNAHYGKPVILLIDEYDVPLARASDFGYYDKMLDIIRALFDKVLKSNEFLKFAVVTGCLKIAKESIFTGANNFVSDTISKNRFNEYIGFTEADVQKILHDTGFQSHGGEIKFWYDGYRFGSACVYCPWDVLNHVAALQVDENSAPESYWENTSHNGIIRRFIDRKDLWKEEQINEDFETLLAGGSITKPITENLAYDMLHSSADNLWSLLYLTGYLTQIPQEKGEFSKTREMVLKIPNEEIRSLFGSAVAEWFKEQVKKTDRTELFDALWGQDENTTKPIAILGIYYIIEDVDEAFNFITTERRITQMKQTIYLDNAATTKTRPQVAEAMLPYFTQYYGNPSSIYEFSTPCKKAIAHARETIAQSIGAKANEIYFTAGGTEADNWAIKATAEAYEAKGRHIITSKIEHHAVLHTCEYLEKRGFEVTYLDVDENGVVKLEELKKAIRPDTILISIMFANNEIGTLQPIKEIGEMAREHGVLFHTDAVQAYAHVPISVDDCQIDMMSVSGHKFNGPKGVGFLYIRTGIKSRSFIHGGAQERKRRGGTENVPGIVGIGKAAELAMADMEERGEKETKLRDYLIRRVLEEVPYTRLNGHRTSRLPNNVNFAFQFIEGESLLIKLDMEGICGSSGSACTSGSLDPSHVLLAIGLPHEIAHGSLRLTLSEENTREEIEFVVDKIKEIVEYLRNMSPLYEDFMRKSAK